MSQTVCLAANCIGYPEGGGHLWVYLNWALGLPTRSLPRNLDGTGRRCGASGVAGRRSDGELEGAAGAVRAGGGGCPMYRVG